MTFTEAVKTCLVEKYATFSGRAPRSEYWYLTLFGYLLSLLIFFIGYTINSLELMMGISLVVCLIFFVPGLAVSVRRLHDTGRSGWWLLLAFLPYIGSIALLIIFCIGSDDDNKYGSNPLTKKIEG